MKELELLQQSRQLESDEQVLNNIAENETEIKRQFTVFFDPTFKEFIDIVGRHCNQDLPLFSQLYILKQIMSFYSYAYSTSFMPVSIFNISLQTFYYLLMNRYMIIKSVKLFNVARIFMFHTLIYFFHEEFFINRYLMNSYKVNINDMFDQDEPFLFQSKAFKSLIKRMHDRHVHLVNQNFDLSSITQDS